MISLVLHTAIKKFNANFCTVKWGRPINYSNRNGWRWVKVARLSFSQIKIWVAPSLLVVRPSALVTSPHISTIWCFRPYKPYIFLKLMAPTIHWPTDHSPITHTDPPDPPNPPRTHLTWPFLHFKTFYAIQTKYFLKPYDTQYPLTHWPITYTDPPSPPYGLLRLAQFTMPSFFSVLLLDKTVTLASGFQVL